MPQLIKYTGPQDTNIFHGYVFTRDVSDDATGGANAVEVPDNIANAALKHPEVFMQWNKKVPQWIKDLRPKLADALQREGEERHRHFALRHFAAQMLTEDSPKHATHKARELSGAQGEMDYAMGLVRQADELRNRIALEQGEPGPQGPAGPTGAPSPSEVNLLEMVKQLQAEIAAMKAGSNASPNAAQLGSLVAEMQQQITQADLDELKLPALVQKALEEAGVRDLTTLASYTAADVRRLNGIGDASLKTITEALATRGLAFAADPA
jgi:hypothetical protein